MTRWEPLAKALAHVQRRERSLPLAKLLLMRALQRIPTRGYVIYWDGPRPEGMEEPLSVDLWTEYDGASPAQINWNEQTATLTGWAHPHGSCKVFRIEVDWPALLAEFSESASPTQLRRRGRGHPPKDTTPIIEAAEELSKRGLLQGVTVTELISGVKDLLPEGMFGEGLLQRTLSDWLKQRQADLGNS